MNALKTKLALIILLLLVIIFIGRTIAYNAASKYGRTLKQSLLMVGHSEFADSAKLRSFLASPEVSVSISRLETLSVLGADYRMLADELRLGVIYLSEQMKLAPEKRFLDTPLFSRLDMPSNDRSDEGVAVAVLTLMASYERQLD